MSRLEEIEAKEGREINEIKSPFMILDCSDYEWLKEQAKRADELENEYQVQRVELLEEHIDRLEKVNRSYKQALEFYAKDDVRGEKARQALEESE